MNTTKQDDNGVQHRLLIVKQIRIAWVQQISSKHFRDCSILLSSPHLSPQE